MGLQRVLAATLAINTTSAPCSWQSLVTRDPFCFSWVMFLQFNLWATNLMYRSWLWNPKFAAIKSFTVRRAKVSYCKFENENENIKREQLKRVTVSNVKSPALPIIINWLAWREVRVECSTALTHQAIKLPSSWQRLDFLLDFWLTFCLRIVRCLAGVAVAKY